VQQLWLANPVARANDVANCWPDNSIANLFAHDDPIGKSLNGVTNLVPDAITHHVAVCESFEHAHGVPHNRSHGSANCAPNSFAKPVTYYESHNVCPHTAAIGSTHTVPLCGSN
jgi:hypothetical protein